MGDRMKGVAPFMKELIALLSLITAILTLAQFMGFSNVVGAFVMAVLV